jgi:hypothetical protein
MARILMIAGLSVSSFALVLEVLARQLYGLGNPPLFLSDPQVEYRLAPNQNLHRFGNRIAINAAGMRSEPLAMPRPAGQRRLLVIGDSVVWGGAQLDQASIATERLRRPGLEVANLGVPSWGPANQLAYLQRYGLFDATDVVLVISSHDAFDVPTFTSLASQPDKPTRKPFSALWEGFERYALPRLRPVNPGSDPPSLQSADATSLEDLDKLLTFISRPGVRVGVVQFWERGEVAGGQPFAGHQEIAQVLKRHGVQPIQSGPQFRKCGSLSALYTDDIHPYTAAGQACLADTILKALEPKLH